MTISERDREAIWHPYTQHKITPLPITIQRGKGAWLYDEKGNRLLDLISSWWVNIHGHAHPDIAKAIFDQAMTLEHVIFSSFTHEPAVQFAEQLLEILPGHFSKIFYSDNGSTAVEVALKMAYQYWRNQGEKKRHRFIAFTNGYHGDTFGTMSVGKKSGFFTAYEDLFFDVDFIDYPSTWIHDEMVLQKEQKILSDLDEHLKKYAHETAAILLEPLIQGAGGMQMCRPEFLLNLETLVRSYNILIIYDEVMTGFGRTGDFFACQKANTTPDIICLSKGITGGFLPFAVTACTEKIYQAFLGDDFGSALAHGHSYAGNPLSCAAALASLVLLKKSETKKQQQMIERTHQSGLDYLADNSRVEKMRLCGTVAAFDLKILNQYGSKESVNLRATFQKKGLLIRPIGNVIYLLPPYCIEETDLKMSYAMIAEALEESTVCQK
ncbi:MAG TPA: adenosylmethionine--8-amino-7-oxononanoate transaminase [Gammaproteobacteria bacterium]|nr:adenosylmethionine--8-amino-7-oxononanoate transaminase [Gammaproteobacteria bacterium]